MKIAILGGGLAGLLLGRRLTEMGVDCVVLEERDEIGGLCRSLRSGPYVWDIGPHAFYSRDPKVMERYHALPIVFRSLRRNVKVAHRDAGGRIRALNYPFENGLADLPLGQKTECLLGYLRASCGGGGFRNLRHWIESGLGAGIARHFMLPYNEKIWDCPLEEISMDLVNRKIDPEPAWRVLRNAFVRGTVGRAYQSRFIYPEKGGAGALPEAVAAPIRDRIRTGWEVARLEPAGKGWTVVSGSGERQACGAVVSTLPLPLLLDALDDPELSPRREDFRHNDTFIVAVGLKEGRDFAAFPESHWVFFAGRECFYRITMNHNLGGSAPPVLTAEITRKGGCRDRTPESVVVDVLRDLRGAGVLAAQDDVALAQAHLERYTYPIQTLGLAEARAGVERRLAARRIYLLGRSGRWDYINTDGVFMRVEDFVDRRLPGMLRDV